MLLLDQRAPTLYKERVTRASIYSCIVLLGVTNRIWPDLACIDFMWALQGEQVCEVLNVLWIAPFRSECTLRLLNKMA